MEFVGVDTILFDMDGTLTDLSKRWWEPFFRAHDKIRPGFDYETGQKVFEQHVGSIIQAAGGHSRFLSLKIFFKVSRAMQLSMWQTWKLMKYIREDEMAFKEIVPLEGAEDVVNTLKARGYKLGLVTSASQSTVDLAQEELMFLSTFDTVISRDIVSQTKPDPEGILLALTKLGSLAKSAVMIGDFPLDVEAGKNAGTRTIGVLGPNGKYTRKLLEEVHPDVLVENITEVLALF